MAMEKQYVIKETHTRSITALGYNPYRREILAGCEDGVIKSIEADTGKVVNQTHEHRGWITDFYYWKNEDSNLHLMLSAANDGNIIAWSSGGPIYDRMRIGTPVYCMVLNPRRGQMICGVNGGIRVYNIDEEKTRGHLLVFPEAFIGRQHDDIVRCLVVQESRVYSAGYDQNLIVYDASFTGNDQMRVISKVKAHDAGISNLILSKDNENNTWVITGSFDKSVKIWSADCKLLHKLDGLLSTVTGICFIPRVKTLWVAAGSCYASLYDPKSGDNVSDFIGTFQHEEEEKYQLQQMKFFPEFNQVVASTSRRNVIVWKYNSSGCITALKAKAPLETLTYTKKVPLLVFSGDHDGVLTKLERMQSNHFMYSQEPLMLTDYRLKKKLLRLQQEKERDKRLAGHARISMLNQKKLEEAAEAKSDSVSNTATALPSVKDGRPVQSHYAFNKPILPAVSVHDHQHTTVLQATYVDHLDILLAASEDSNIYVWGFDDSAVDVLRSMRPQDADSLIRKYAILLDKSSDLHPSNRDHVTNEDDSVTNRVAGFVCKHVLSGHFSCVTSMAVIGPRDGYDTTYVVSGGWDGRLCIWDLQEAKLADTFRNTAPGADSESEELACDGIIVKMTYSPKLKELAYSSSDKMVYLRKFSPDGSKMVLVNTLQGHDGEVTAVLWNPITEKWVTGSEDGTIRIWSCRGMNECEQVLSAQGPVTTMCVDMTNSSLVAGVQNVIRVYEPEQYRLVQTNVGHTDSVRSIIHIPERNQYVSCSWDKSIRIWNAWKLPRKKKKTAEEEQDEERERQIKQKIKDQQGTGAKSVTTFDDEGLGSDGETTFTPESSPVPPD